MTEKEALTEKLTHLIDQYRHQPEKSEELARVIIQFIEQTGRPGSAHGSWNHQQASREDIGLILLEIQHLRKEVEYLKSKINHV